MASLGTFIKQPAEIMDYDLDFSTYLPSDDVVSGSGVLPSEVTVIITSTTENPVALVNDANYLIDSGKGVKVWLSAGTSGVSYKVTVRAGTAGGRLKEVEFRIKCKDQ